MPATGDRPEAHGTHTFRVKKGSAEIAAFKECTGPSLQMDVYEYEEGGTNGFVHKLPGRWKIGNITLKRGICRSDALWEWCQKALKGVTSGTWELEPENISIELCDSEGKQVRSWSFINAYPVKWSAPTFKADENAVSVEELELAHEGLLP